MCYKCISCNWGKPQCKTLAQAETAALHEVKKIKNNKKRLCEACGNEFLLHHSRIVYIETLNEPVVGPNV